MPRLAKLVRSVCCGPPATVGDESLFSIGKDIVRPNRNRLSAQKLEILTFFLFNGKMILAERAKKGKEVRCGFVERNHIFSGDVFSA